MMNFRKPVSKKKGRNYWGSHLRKKGAKLETQRFFFNLLKEKSCCQVNQMNDIEAHTSISRVDKPKDRYSSEPNEKNAKNERIIKEIIIDFKSGSLFVTSFTVT